MRMDLIGITVCVEYADILNITLAYNRHHFDRFLVVTHPDDHPTIDAAERCDAEVLLTTVFYEKGAAFNKWAALEAGIEWAGRKGWMVVMDADIMMPVSPPAWNPKPGNLYTPKRRILKELEYIPAEPYWPRQKVIHEEHAGYFQMFHADDPVLISKPWFPSNFAWAGTADTLFQQRWAESRKLRPPFEVLHLGEVHQNWAGRITPFIDGTSPKDVESKQMRFQQFIKERRLNYNGRDRYKGEKIL